MPTDYLAEAITEAFGERCPDIAEGCACCEAWSQYDRLTSATPPDVAKIADAIEACDWSDVSIGNKAILRQAATALRLSAGGGWQSIESAPHNRTVILGWHDWRDGQWCMEIGAASTGQRYDSGASSVSRHGSATHWLPLTYLPASPTVEAGHVE